MKFSFVCFWVLCFLCANVSSQSIQPILKTKFDYKLKESSGLVFTKHGLWSFNDGKSASIYRIDTTTGTILQEVKMANTSFIDAEAIAKDDQYLYIEDAGNNDGHRKDLKIVRIRLTDIDTSLKVQTVFAEEIKFNYPEQTGFSGDKKDNNFDCESMIATKDSLYLFTKRRGDYQSSIYVLPKNSGTVQAHLAGTFNVKGLVTDAALSPNGKYLVLIGYQKGHYNSFIWIFHQFKKDHFFEGENKLLLLNEKNDTWQTEGITFLNDSSLFISCESTEDHSASLYFLNAKTIK